MLYTLRLFSSKCSLFHNANLFGSCIIHILYTGCAKIEKKNNSGAKGLSISAEYEWRYTTSPLPHEQRQPYLYSFLFWVRHLLCYQLFSWSAYREFRANEWVKETPSRIRSRHIIIFIYCNWVVTRWQWLFYTYTKHEIGYYWILVGRATWEACRGNLESWEPSQHLLIDTGETKKSNEFSLQLYC